jgi:hypothetical protein
VREINVQNGPRPKLDHPDAAHLARRVMTVGGEWLRENIDKRPQL